MNAAQMAAGKRTRVTDLNSHLMCVLCGGYLIDATTITECLHSFCRTCILQYLLTSKYCPVCDVQVYKSRPACSIAPDITLQRLVFKLIPDLYQDEMRRRKEFFKLHPEAAKQTTFWEARGDVRPQDCPFLSPGDKISVCLEHSDRLCPLGFPKNKRGHVADQRHLLCPAALPIGLLKKFLSHKFGLPSDPQIEVFHQNDPLQDDDTLLDVIYMYNWSRKKPLLFHYVVSEAATKPKEGLPQSKPVPSAKPTGKKRGRKRKHPLPAAAAAALQRHRQRCHSPDVGGDSSTQPLVAMAANGVASAASATSLCIVETHDVSPHRASASHVNSGELEGVSMTSGGGHSENKTPPMIDVSACEVIDSEDDIQVIESHSTPVNRSFALQVTRGNNGQGEGEMTESIVQSVNSPVSVHELDTIDGTPQVITGVHEVHSGVSVNDVSKTWMPQQTILLDNDITSVPQAEVDPSSSQDPCVLVENSTGLEHPVVESHVIGDLDTNGVFTQQNTHQFLDHPLETDTMRFDSPPISSGATCSVCPDIGLKNFQQGSTDVEVFMDDVEVVTEITVADDNSTCASNLGSSSAFNQSEHLWSSSCWVANNPDVLRDTDTQPLHPALSDVTPVSATIPTGVPSLLSQRQVLTASNPTGEAQEVSQSLESKETSCRKDSACQTDPITDLTPAKPTPKAADVNGNIFPGSEEVTSTVSFTKDETRRVNSPITSPATPDTISSTAKSCAPVMPISAPYNTPSPTTPSPTTPSPATDDSIITEAANIMLSLARETLFHCSHSDKTSKRSFEHTSQAPDLHCSNNSNTPSKPTPPNNATNVKYSNTASQKSGFSASNNASSPMKLQPVSKHSKKMKSSPVTNANVVTSLPALQTLRNSRSDHVIYSDVTLSESDTQNSAHAAPVNTSTQSIVQYSNAGLTHSSAPCTSRSTDHTDSSLSRDEHLDISPGSNSQPNSPSCPIVQSNDTLPGSSQSETSINSFLGQSKSSIASDVNPSPPSRKAAQSLAQKSAFVNKYFVSTGAGRLGQNNRSKAGVPTFPSRSIAFPPLPTFAGKTASQRSTKRVLHTSSSPTSTSASPTACSKSPLKTSASCEAGMSMTTDVNKGTSSHSLTSVSSTKLKSDSSRMISGSKMTSVKTLIPSATGNASLIMKAIPILPIGSSTPLTTFTPLSAVKVPLVHGMPFPNIQQPAAAAAAIKSNLSKKVDAHGPSISSFPKGCPISLMSVVAKDGLRNKAICSSISTAPTQVLTSEQYVKKSSSTNNFPILQRHLHADKRSDSDSSSVTSADNGSTSTHAPPVSFTATVPCYQTPVALGTARLPSSVAKNSSDVHPPRPILPKEDPPLTSGVVNASSASSPSQHNLTLADASLTTITSSSTGPGIPDGPALSSRSLPAHETAATKLKLSTSGTSIDGGHGMRASSNPPQTFFAMLPSSSVSYIIPSGSPMTSSGTIRYILPSGAHLSSGTITYITPAANITPSALTSVTSSNKVTPVGPPTLTLVPKSSSSSSLQTVYCKPVTTATNIVSSAKLSSSSAKGADSPAIFTSSSSSMASVVLSSSSSSPSSSSSSALSPISPVQTPTQNVSPAKPIAATMVTASATVAHDHDATPIKKLKLMCNGIANSHNPVQQEKEQQAFLESFTTTPISAHSDPVLKHRSGVTSYMHRKHHIMKQHQSQLSRTCAPPSGVKNNKPVANGYDAPLELTTRPVQDRRKSSGQPP